MTQRMPVEFPSREGIPTTGAGSPVLLRLISDAGAGLLASPGHRRPWIRAALGLLAGAAMAVVPASAASAQALASHRVVATAAVRAPSARAAEASGFCSRIPIHQVSVIVGHPVSVIPESARNVSTCLYRWGSGATSFEHDVTLSMVKDIPTNIPRQEVNLAKEYAKLHAHCSFSRLPYLGSRGFQFRCMFSIFIYSGVSTARGTTGYTAVALGALTLSQEERLLKLVVAAG